MAADVPDFFIHVANPTIHAWRLTKETTMMLTEHYDSLIADEAKEEETKEIKRTLPAWMATLEKWVNQEMHGKKLTQSAMDAVDLYLTKCFRDFWIFFNKYGIEWAVVGKNDPWFLACNELMSVYPLFSPLPVGIRLFHGVGVFEDMMPWAEVAKAELGTEIITQAPTSTSWRAEAALGYCVSKGQLLMTTPAWAHDHIRSYLIVFEVGPGAIIPAIPIEALPVKSTDPRFRSTCTECEINLPPFLKCKLMKQTFHKSLPLRDRSKQEISNCIVLFMRLLSVVTS